MYESMISFRTDNSTSKSILSNIWVFWIKASLKVLKSNSHKYFDIFALVIQLQPLKKALKALSYTVHYLLLSYILVTTSKVGLYRWCPKTVIHPAVNGGVQVDGKTLEFPSADEGVLIHCIILYDTVCGNRIWILDIHSVRHTQKFNSTYAVGPKVVNCLYRTAFHMHSYLMDFELIKNMTFIYLFEFIN